MNLSPKNELPLDLFNFLFHLLSSSLAHGTYLESHNEFLDQVPKVPKKNKVALQLQKNRVVMERKIASIVLNFACIANLIILK